VLTRLAGCERGTVLVMMAVSAPLFIGTFALAVEIPQAMVARQRAQVCADNAAIAGAVASLDGTDVGGAARAYASVNRCDNAEVVPGGGQVTVTVTGSAMGVPVSARAVARSTPTVALIE
jgi:Flp pilus assembly protein TadG